MLSEQLFHDKSKDGVINSRILMAPARALEHLELDTKQKTEFFNALVFQARKVLSIWTHYRRFKEEEEALIKEAPVISAESQAPVSISYSQDLFMEFDEFLVQYKSSLDYLAKIPSPLLGYNRWNPRTFGEKGELIVKMLRSVLKKRKGDVQGFETLIFGKHKEDIKMVVEARDKMNHFTNGGIPFRHFAVYGVRENDEVVFRFPMWSSDQRTSEFMRVVFYNHLRFCEDFIFFFLGLYLTKEYGFFHRSTASDSPESPYELIPVAALPFYEMKYGVVLDQFFPNTPG